MATSGASEGGFSGRANFVLRYEISRISQPNRTTNRWHAALFAINRSGYASYDLTARPWSVGGVAGASGSWVPDFRGTNQILLWAADFDYGTNAAGYSDISWSASAGPAGIFGSASTSGSFSADRIPQPPSKMGTPAGSSSTSSAITWAMPGPPGDDGGSGINLYQWQKARNSAFTTEESNGSTAGGSTPVTTSGLLPNTTYYMHVRARNGVDWGPWSNTATYATKVGVPSAPQSPTVTETQPATVTLAWTAPATNNGGAVTGYVVQVSTSSSMTSATEYTTGTGLSYTVQNLLPSTTYYFRIIAVNSAGRSPVSAVVSGITVSGAYVSVNNQWRGAGVFVSDGTSWKPCTIAVDLGGRSNPTETNLVLMRDANNPAENPVPGMTLTGLTPGTWEVQLALAISMNLNSFVKSGIARVRDGSLTGPVLASYVFSDKGDSSAGNAETWNFSGSLATTTGTLMVTIQSNNANAPQIYSAFRSIGAGTWTDAI